MSKFNNDGLDQYGAGPFEQQQFGTAGVEGVKPNPSNYYALPYKLNLPFLISGIWALTTGARSLLSQGVLFLPERDHTLRSGLCCRKSVCRL